ncbi:MAG TPA: hypothetical protein VJC39_02170 [Candidatus Nanoarchaeia archaeon]|nr:hypothetical protein [Candidatus Nanoarchaeia archaeon]
MSKEAIKSLLRKIIGQEYLELTTRGNSAIKAALSVVAKENKEKNKNLKVLIPQEGGWLTYKTIPESLGLEITEVKCVQGKISLADLEQKLSSGKYGALIYQNPGGYFAEQPAEKIYTLGQQHKCRVVVDISGAIGTELGSGKWADFLVGSFGEWKLIDAGKGGFISAKSNKLWNLIPEIEELNNQAALLKIQQKIKDLPNRISLLTQARETIIEDLKKSSWNLVRPDDFGLVVVVKFSDDEQKKEIIEYCRKNDLEWTECPRYIRLNEPAISIEVKRL